MTVKIGDIDIDLADRQLLLNHIRHIPAAIHRDQQWIKHNTGIYVTDIPENPVLNAASIDYQEAENRGYVKIDLLNNSVYQQVRDRKHLEELVRQSPDWQRLQDREFFQQLVHIGNHYDLYRRLAEPISSIEHMAMFLALIRPAKRNLVGLPWKRVAESIWAQSTDGTYGFKRSHSFSYSYLVVVHMNLISSLD